MLRRGSCFGTCQLASPISNKSQHASSFPSSLLPFIHHFHLCPDALVAQENAKLILVFSGTWTILHPSAFNSWMKISKFPRCYNTRNSEHTNSWSPAIQSLKMEEMYWWNTLIWQQEGDGHSIAKDIQLEVPELCIPPSQFKKYHTKVYPGAAWTYGKGSTFMDEFDDDEHAATREDNLYYPWASRPEWELASFLLCLSLSMADIDQFLSLDLVSESLLILHMNDLWPSHIDQTLRTFILYCQRSSSWSNHVFAIADEQSVITGCTAIWASAYLQDIREVDACLHQVADWGCSMEDAGERPTLHLLYKILTSSRVNYLKAWLF